MGTCKFHFLFGSFFIVNLISVSCLTLNFTVHVGYHLLMLKIEMGFFVCLSCVYPFELYKGTMLDLKFT